MLEIFIYIHYAAMVKKSDWYICGKNMQAISSICSIFNFIFHIEHKRIKHKTLNILTWHFPHITRTYQFSWSFGKMSQICDNSWHSWQPWISGNLEYAIITKIIKYNKSRTLGWVFQIVNENLRQDGYNCEFPRFESGAVIKPFLE